MQRPADERESATPETTRSVPRTPSDAQQHVLDVRLQLRDARRYLAVLRLGAIFGFGAFLAMSWAANPWFSVFALAMALFVGWSLHQECVLDNLRRRQDDLEQGWRIPE